MYNFISFAILIYFISEYNFPRNYNKYYFATCEPNIYLTINIFKS